MRAWLIRFVSLYVFNVVVLLLIGLFIPAVSVGVAVLWAALVLTAATLWVKPAITSWFRGRAARSADRRTKVTEKLVQAGLVLLVAYIVWVLTALLSGVKVHGWFWGYIIPPIALLIAWSIYAAIDDKVEAQAGVLYDRATGRTASAHAGAGASNPSITDAPLPELSAEARAAQRELHDGLTDEQRRMLEDLGKS